MMVRVRIEVEGEAETNILREIFFCRILGGSQVSFKFSKIVEIPCPKFLLSKFYRTDAEPLKLRYIPKYMILNTKRRFSLF